MDGRGENVSSSVLFFFWGGHGKRSAVGLPVELRVPRLDIMRYSHRLLCDADIRSGGDESVAKCDPL